MVTTIGLIGHVAGLIGQHHWNTQPNVKSVHDLHVWGISTSENAVTAHVVLASSVVDHGELLRDIEELLHKRFEITHITIQFENLDFAENCVSRSFKCNPN